MVLCFSKNPIIFCTYSIIYVKPILIKFIQKICVEFKLKSLKKLLL